MSEDTYGITKQDVAKMQQQESRRHGGDVPSDSRAAGLQSIVDSGSKNKEAIIAERQAALPLPEQPPGPSDFNSADQTTVNVGSGYRQDDVTVGQEGASAGLREPATAESAVRIDGDEWKQPTAGAGVGREAVEGLSGPPSDAVKGPASISKDVEETRNK